MNDFEGMTTNERLYAVGNFERFHDAMRQREFSIAKGLLMAAGFSTDEAESIVEMILERDS